MEINSILRRSREIVTAELLTDQLPEVRIVSTILARQPHRALDGATPDTVYFDSPPVALAA